MKINNSNKLKRGISLIEVVIAIFIITLISASAVSLIITANKNDQKNIRDTEIALATKTVVDCFNYADDYSEFLLTLKEVDDYVESNGAITLTKQSYSLKIVAEFDQNKVTIKAFDNGEKELSEVIYNKG